MAGASMQARRLLDELKKKGIEKLPEQLSGEDQELVALEQEIGPDRARHLQPQVGNQALQNLLQRNGRLGQESAGLEIEVEEEGAEQEGMELEEAGPEEASLESSFAAALSSAAVGSAGSSYDAQDADFDQQYGGDADPEPPPEKPRRAFRQGRNRRLPMRRDQPISQEQAAEELEALDLPPLAHPSEPQGDEHLDALWGWLTDPVPAALPELEPEDLVRCPEPLARCISVGRFLAHAGRDPLARGLGALVGPLPGGPGLATQVARAAALAGVAGLIEAEEAGVAVVNKAATLVLEDDAVEHGRRAARRCVRRARLAAHYIFEEATAGGPPPEGRAPGRRERPGRRAQGLVTAALEDVVQPKLIPLSPRRPKPSGGDSTASEETAEIDALLRSLTGASEELAGAVDHLTLAPLINGIEDMVNAAGRTQIEVAAAAIAVERATVAVLRGRLLGLLKASDRELRALAREAIGVGRGLEALVSMRLEDAQARLDEAEGRMIDLRERLVRLRESSFAALGAVALAGDSAAAARP